MSSVYLVRSGDKWLRQDYHLCVKVFEDIDGSLGVSHPADAAIFATRERAVAAARTYGGGEPVEFREVTGDTAAGAPTHLHVVFDGPPGPDGGKFVEVENDAGQSVHAGEWVRRDDGLWSLRLRVFCAGDTAAGALAAAEATIARLREEIEQLRNRPSTHELAKRYLEATE